MQFYFPIKYKFLSVLISILLFALSIFFYLAFKTFSEDKKLFIMDLNLSVLQAATSDVRSDVKERLEEIQVLVPRIYNPDQYGKEIKQDPYQGLSEFLPTELMSVSFYKENEKEELTLAKTYKNDKLIEEKKLGANILSVLDKQHPLSIDYLSAVKGLEIKNRSVKDPESRRDVAVLSFVFNGSFVNVDSKGVVIVVNILQDFLRKRLQQSELAELFVISKDGTLISHPDLGKTVNFSKKKFPHPIVRRLMSKQLPRESMELVVDGEPYLCNLSLSGFTDIFLVSQVQKSEAFLALTTLITKTALVAGVIISLSILFSIIFAGRLTANIQKLKQAAENIGGGNFKMSLRIRSNDELERVSESFQWMAQRINELIDETAQQARMESELKTAQLVQSTLLQPPKIESNAIVVSSHMVPASETGGDFWDLQVSDTKATLIIGDATGHGAPAALVTAVAKSCFSTLNSIYHTNPIAPDQLLYMLNHIIHSTCKGELLMTACLVQLDLTTGELVVCNAGHEAPMLLRQGAISSEAQNADKKKGSKAEILFSRGERLGFEDGVLYESKSFQIEVGDTILLYTDGITEAEDVSGKEWGERKLKKIFASNGPRPAADIKRDIVEAVDIHIKDAEQKDDITFVVMKWNKKIEQKNADSEAA